MKGSNVNDYSEQIKKGLSKVEYLYKDTIEFKKLLIREIKKGDDYNREIENLKIQVKMKTDEIKNEECGKIISEKKDLLENIATVSQEVKKKNYI